MTGLTPDLDQFGSEARCRAEALVLARDLWPTIQPDDGLKVAGWVIGEWDAE